MKTPKIINAINFVEDDLISAANEQKAKKPFYIKPVFRRATAIAACLAIVAVTAFTLTKKPDNNITSNNSETSSQNKKVIYVTGDTQDEEISVGNVIKSLDDIYISRKLQEKMKLYKDYKEAEVVYRVFVELFIAGEDMREGEKLADADKEVRSLYEQYLAAREEEDKAEAEYYAFCEANPGNEPEIIAERHRMVLIIESKEKIRCNLHSKWDDKRREIIGNYTKSVRTERLKFATQFSEKEPIQVIDSYYAGRAYYMDLTAEEINILAEKGGYAFRLNNSDYISEPA